MCRVGVSDLFAWHVLSRKSRYQLGGGKQVYTLLTEYGVEHFVDGGPTGDSALLCIFFGQLEPGLARLLRGFGVGRAFAGVGQM